jgi:hypothetical protein
MLRARGFFPRQAMTAKLCPEEVLIENREHQNFEESTEVIKPLTEEEKKSKLIELRERFYQIHPGSV